MFSTMVKSIGNSVIWFRLGLATLPVFVLYLWLRRTTCNGGISNVWTSTSGVKSLSQGLFDFSFLSAHCRRVREVCHCTEMFNNNSIMSMSDSYRSHLKEFNSEVAKYTKQPGWQGFSMQTFELYKASHRLAGLPFVTNICETGFNFGHSSFNWLTANDRVMVRLFDLGDYPHARLMAEYLQSKFPGRLFVTFGDSTKTIPEFIMANPSHHCDIMFVDGGHKSPRVIAILLVIIMLAALVYYFLIKR